MFCFYLTYLWSSGYGYIIKVIHDNDTGWKQIGNN